MAKCEVSSGSIFIQTQSQLRKFHSYGRHCGDDPFGWHQIFSRRFMPMGILLLLFDYKIHSFTHSGPKMLKSKQRGAGPKFIYHVKGGYIVISKNKIFFKSVEGKFWQFSEKIWTGFPRALPPGISMKQKF